MGGDRQDTPQQGGGASRDAQMDRQMLALGQLHFLAAFCPLHQRLPAGWLARIFLPALNNDCVRFFHNDQGQVCAALIWARLNDEVSERMIYENVPPGADDWASGENLWFLDMLAPFNHGRTVARHIARNPPEGPFYFARLDGKGRVSKVVRGDASVRGRDRLRSFFVDRTVDRTYGEGG